MAPGEDKDTSPPEAHPTKPMMKQPGRTRATPPAPPTLPFDTSPYKLREVEEIIKKASQFRSIALLNVEGKIFFSILARRWTNFLMANGYINKSCQKARIPGLTGYIEVSSVIWEQIQRAKKVSRLDSLANSYIQKWLGLPNWFLDAGLFGCNMLELHMNPSV
eukprot:superscaffoldBa00012496_g25676